MGAVVLAVSHRLGNRSDGRIIAWTSAGLSVVSLAAAELLRTLGDSELPLVLLRQSGLPLHGIDAFPVVMTFDAVARWFLWPIALAGLIKLSADKTVDETTHRWKMTWGLCLLACLESAALASSLPLLLGSFLLTSCFLFMLRSIDTARSGRFDRTTITADILILLACGVLWSAFAGLEFSVLAVAPDDPELRSQLGASASLIVYALVVAGFLRSGLLSLAKSTTDDTVSDWSSLSLCLGPLLIIRAIQPEFAFYSSNLGSLPSMALMLSCVMAFFAMTVQRRPEVQRLLISSLLGIAICLLLARPQTSSDSELPVIAFAILLSVLISDQARNRVSTLLTVLVSVVILTGSLSLNLISSAAVTWTDNGVLRSNPVTFVGSFVAQLWIAIAWVRWAYTSDELSNVSEPTPAAVFPEALKVFTMLGLIGICLSEAARSHSWNGLIGPMTLAGLIGGGLVWAVYRNGSRLSAGLRERFDSLHRLSDRRFYVQEVRSVVRGLIRWVQSKMTTLENFFLVDGPRDIRSSAKRMINECFEGIWMARAGLSALLVIVGAAIIWLMFSDFAPVY